MARFDHDVFISYARANNHDGWVRKFEGKLKALLSEQLTDEAKVYFDDESIERNEEFDEAIDAAIKSSEVLLVVGSNKYLTRKWCDFERSTFLKHRDKSNIVLIRYEDVDLPALHKVLPKHLGHDFFDDAGMRLGTGSDEFSRVIHALCRELKAKLSRAIFPKGLAVEPPSGSPATTKIEEPQINQLIACLRNFDEDPNYNSSRLGQAVTIANAFIRRSILCDFQFSQEEHMFKTIIHGLVREMVSTEVVHPLPRFVVLLHKLMSGDEAVVAQLQNWFDQVCVPAGFGFDQLAADLPPCPAQAQQFVWMDIVWDDALPGDDKAIAAHAYLRCGHLQYKYADVEASDKPLQQSSQLIRRFLKKDSAKAQLNHVSVVVDPDDFHLEWERDDIPAGTDLLKLPVSLRCKSVAAGRVCPVEIEPAHLIEFCNADLYSTQTIQTGIFATSKTDSVNGKPCDVLKGLLTNASVGLWTRGPSGDNDPTIHTALKNSRLSDVPNVVHKNRRGSNPDSFWRRVVLYFNPNIPPLRLEEVDDILDTTFQLE